MKVMKIFKVLRYLILIILLLLASILSYLFFVLDPNDYKPQIIKGVESNLPVKLQLGSLSWTLFPHLAISLNEASLKALNGEDLFSFNLAKLSVDVRALFSGKIKASDIQFLDPTAYYKVSSDGSTNWDDLFELGNQPDQKPVEPNAKQDTSNQALDINIRDISLENVTILYSDTSTNQHISIKPLNLKVTGFSFDKPFTASLNFLFKDQTNLQVNSKLTSQVTLNLNNQKVFIKKLTTDTEILTPDLPGQPIRLTSLINADIDLKQQQLELYPSSIQWQPIKLSFDGNIKDFQSAPKLAVNLKTNEFNPLTVMDNLNLSKPELTDSGAMQTAQVSASIFGDLNQVKVDLSNIKLDQTHLTGMISASELSKPEKSLPNISAKFKVDKINLDRYLPNTDSEQPDSDQTPEQEEEAVLIPVTPLKALSFDLSTHIDELIVKKVPISNLNLVAKGQDGLIELSEITGKGLGGTFKSEAMLDVRQNTPTMRFKQNIDAFSLNHLSNYLGADQVLAGLFYLNADLTSEGNTVKALTNTLSGNTNIKLNEGLLKGVSLSGLAYNQLGSLGQLIQPLLDTNEQIPSPKVFRKDTEIKDFVSNIVFEPGKVKAKELKGNIDGNAKILGSASVDTESMVMDLDLNLTLDEAISNPYLSQLSWPISCTGSISATPKCAIDTSKIRKQLGRMIEEKAKADLKQKAKEKLTEKLKGKIDLPIDTSTGEEASPEALLKEKEKQLKQEAKEKINEKLNENLEKLFKF